VAIEFAILIEDNGLNRHQLKAMDAERGYSKQKNEGFSENGSAMYRKLEAEVATDLRLGFFSNNRMYGNEKSN